MWYLYVYVLYLVIIIIFTVKICKPWQCHLLTHTYFSDDDLYWSKHVGKFLNDIKNQYLYSDGVYLYLIISLQFSKVPWWAYVRFLHHAHIFSFWTFIFITSTLHAPPQRSTVKECIIDIHVYALQTTVSVTLKESHSAHARFIWWTCFSVYGVAENGGNVGLFSLPTYRVYVVPRLLQIFCVRDAQVRLLLLTHFSSYCSSFTEDQLRTLVLPEASFTMLEFCCYSCISILISNSGINIRGLFGK